MTATYDTSYRLTGLTDIRAGIALRDETYAWTNRDNLAGVTDNLDPAQNQAFTYSNREFLAAADGAWGEFDWLYDSVGNRREQSTLAGGISVADTYSYWSDTNQLDRVDLATGNARQFLYDGAGNVISDRQGAREYSYTYDAANRMSSFSVNGVTYAEYEYNYLGQQVINRQVQNGQTIHSIHDAAGQRIAEYLYNDATGTSTLIREYIWANAQIVGVVENGALYYVRTDHIGRPVFATDDTGAKVWTASYLPFGGVQASSGSNPDLRFPGQWFQSENGLHQNWMRDYDPTTGRYMQADPLGLVDGASIYGYALQNPGRYVDPWGLFTLDDARTKLNNDSGYVPRRWDNRYNELFDSWLDLERGDVDWHDNLPEPCPCNINERGDGWTNPRPSSDRYHEGGYQEIRKPSPDGSGAGSQCVYDRNGRLMTQAPAAGTADRYLPNWPDDPPSVGQHWRHDVQPYDLAIRLGREKAYYEVRPLMTGGQCCTE